MKPKITRTMSNSGFQKSHDHLWHTPDGNRTMAIQFLLNMAESRKFNYFAKKTIKKQFMDVHYGAKHCRNV